MPFDGTPVLYKYAATGKKNDGSFVMSSPSIDSYGDIVKGPWRLERFLKNPVALAGHNASVDHIIGKWEKVHVDASGNLVGHLVFAAPGTSPIADAARALYEQGLLVAASVGFECLDPQPRDPKNPRAGYVLSDNILYECSLVSIPANEDALRRALRYFSDQVQTLWLPKSGACRKGSACDVFQSSQTRVSVKATATPSTLRNPIMTLAERIKAKQAELNDFQDQVVAVTDSVDATGALSEDQQVQLDDLATRIERSTAELESLSRAEQALARKAAVAGPAPSAEKKEAARIQLIDNKPKGHKAIQAVSALVKALGSRQDPVQVAREHYRDQADIELLVRASTDPATTSDSTWATNLMQQEWGGFLELLRDSSVVPQVPGLRVTLNGTYNVPVQNGRGNLAAGFIAENGAIPVKEGSIGTTSLAPKKLGVISAYTRELARRSMPSIEAIVRSQMLADTAEALDTAFFSTTARSSTAPAGLRDTTDTGAANVNAVTNTATGDHGCTVAEIISDTSAVLTRVWAIKANAGVWIMNPAQKLALEDKQDATTGYFVFKDEVMQNRFRGYPIITSTNVTAGIVAFVANNAMAFGNELSPYFEMSDSATLHFENASPSAISASATPNTVAAPVISLFQQDLFALKMIWTLDWKILRQAGVQVLTAATGW